MSGFSLNRLFRDIGNSSAALDKGVFIATFVLGASFMITAKGFGASQFVVTTVPLTLMVLYMAAILYFRRLRVDAAQAGDNLYYLGFLYTLTSLSLALYYFSESAVDKGGIITNFGIALATTILGILLRVVCGQMQHDPIETERQTRMELVELATKLRDDLIVVRGTMDVALVAVQQQAAATLNGYASQLHDMASGLVEKTSSHFKSLSQEAGRFNEGTSQLVAAVESLVDRVNRIQAPNDLLATKLAPCVEAISEASDEVRKRAKADKGIVEKLAAAVENVATVAEKAETKIQAAAEEGGKAEALLAKLSAIAEKFDQAATRSKESAEQARTVSAANEALQSRLNDSLSQVSASLSEGARLIVSRQDAALKHLEAAVTETVLRMKSHNEALASELTQSRQYTEEVHSALVSVAKSVTKQLNS
jgi:hypothetical protein